MTNGFGDEVRDYGDTDEVEVFAFYVTGGEEVGTDGHVQQVSYDAVVFAPDELNITAGDEVELPNVGVFKVEGPPGNWDNNPWFTPGLVQVRLRRVEHED